MLVQKEMSAESLAKLADGGFVYAVIDACDKHELVLNKAIHDSAYRISNKMEEKPFAASCIRKSQKLAYQ